jgi:DNA-binding CsgD family transcriptional regulator/tetratricopeptide (TPR) repeat protein
VNTRAALLESFSGRREELAFLLEKRAHCIREGSGSAVLVTGEAGIGKSRLLAEYAKCVSSAGGIFVRGRCDEMSALPYGPFLDAFAQLERIGDASVRKSILPARAAIENEHAVVADTPTEQRRQRYAALCRGIEGAARSVGHLTLAIDDVHWIDLTSLDVLGSIVSLSSRVPMLLILSARSEDLERDLERSVALARIEREGVDRIRLAGLERHQLLEPLQELLPRAPRDVVTRIYELSEGKPYVVEELARSVIEHGGESLAEVPMTLRGAVLERFAQLDEDARSIVRRASVFGRNFRIEDILGLGHDRSDVLRALRTARDLQLVTENADGFRFRHALTRDVLYRELLAPERRALHREIADAIEAGSPGERLGELAFHRWGAGDAARARRSALDAADRARSIGAYADAAEHYRRALEATDDAHELTRTAMLAIGSLRPLGRIDEVLALCEQTIRRLDRAGLAEDVFDIRLAQLRTLLFTSNVDAMTAVVAEIVHLLETCDVSAQRRFEAECQFCDYRLVSLACDDASAHLARAEAILPQRTFAQENRLLSLRGMILRLTHRYCEAATVFEQLRERALATNDDRLLANTLSNLGFVRVGLGGFRDGIAFCEESVAHYDRLGLLQNANNIRAEAALIASMHGDFDDVRRTFDAAERSGAGMSHAMWTIPRMRLVRACGGDVRPFIDLTQRPQLVQLYIMTMLLWDLPWACDDRNVVRALFDRRALLVGNVVYGELPYLYAVATLGSDTQFDEVARAQIEAPDHEDAVGVAWDALLAARILDRGEGPGAGVGRAREAVEGFRALEMPIELAHALELAGQPSEARVVLRRVGALAELRRFEGGTTTVRSRARLSARERQIAELLARGLSSREASQQLGIGVRTVETHVANVYEKLGLRSRLELADWLRAEGA